MFYTESLIHSILRQYPFTSILTRIMSINTIYLSVEGGGVVG